MGWFESQIEERRSSDQKRIEESLQNIADAITGRIRNGGIEAAEQAKTALSAVLRYYGTEVSSDANIDADPTDMNTYLDAQLHATGIMCRPVRLTEGWEKDAAGAMLGFIDETTPVALIPRTRGGYAYRDPATGERMTVGKLGSAEVAREAYCFYRPLPDRKITIPDLIWHMARSLDPSDYAALVVSTLVPILLGTLTPRITKIIYGQVIQSGNTSIVFPVISLLLGVSISSALIGIANTLVTSRIGTKLNMPLEAAIMMRVLSLPASFFAEHQTGELSNRISAVQTVATTLRSMVFSTTLSSLFSVVYLVQITSIAPTLVVPALLTILASTALTVVTTIIQQRVTKKNLDIASKLMSTEYALISGIQKIKVAGAESRAFANWADAYADQARLTYNGPLLLRLSATLQTAVTIISTIVIYSLAIGGNIGLAGYMAFTDCFGKVSGAFSSLSSAALQIAQIRPYLELAAPILEAEPESAKGKTVVGKLSGSINIENVVFSYGEGLPNVLDGLSLKIERGSYVAIVGKTGCGKSTLLRLLLGFEEPQRGGIYYDSRDLKSLDKQSVRKNIGVVLQNGKLFQGTIYENIAISAPGLSMDDAWKAAERAGFADDIRDMPMGMQTFIAEGGGGISGGQRQRLMIARAIAGDPRIIMFDEATSALDNVTQSIVSDSLDELKCTRIVIAHRLSTIKHCDRIILLDQGRIAEDGSYDELIEKNGLFADLVARQQV